MTCRAINPSRKSPTGRGNRGLAVGFVGGPRPCRPLRPSCRPSGQYQAAHPQQVIGTGHPVEGLLRPLDPSIARLPQAPDRLDPAKDLFDPFSNALTDLVARVPGGAPLQAGRATSLDLSNMRLNLAAPQEPDERR